MMTARTGSGLCALDLDPQFSRRSGGALCLPALAEEFTEFADRLLVI
jgi:hypothetical protein